MKINEVAVLNEAKKIDEAPYGILKGLGDKVAAKMGSQRAADAGAIGKEANALKKQFTSFWKNANAQQPTKEIMVQYLQAKGFPIANTQELDSIAKSVGKPNPGIAQKIAKGWKNFKKGLPKMTGAKPTALKPNLNVQDGGKEQEKVAASMYEAVPKSQILSDKAIDQILMYIVRAGFQQRADLGGASSFAPNTGGTDTKPTSTGQSAGGMTQGKDGVWRFN